MTLRQLRPAIAFAVFLTSLLLSPMVEAQPKILVNEFYRGGTLSTTDEWIELVLTVPLTAAELNGFFVGDSTAATAAKFSGYQFTNMGTIAANFPAGTIIVVGGTTALTQDISYNPGGGDWNILLRTAGGFLTSNGNAGDLAGTDVVYVDTNGTSGDATLSADGFSVNYDSTPGAFGLIASVTIGVPANNSGAVLTTDLTGATSTANWTVSVALASMTLGQANGGGNTTYIDGLRGAPPAGPSLSINDVSLAEGDAGTTTFTFTATLSAPAPAGGVTFDIATADNTATTADNDYLANSLGAQTIAMGNTTYTFDVTVNGDTTIEANETFFVNVTSVVGTGVTLLDGQGLGTISNDDVVLTPIHDIQGPGVSSPLAGVVSTRGVVTGLKSNGFFIQEPDATVDADPATSEGIFVFTSAAPPAAAAVGNLVQVTGTISEFSPSQDPLQPPLTELTSPTVVMISAGNPLPAAIPLTATFPDPAGPFNQLERVEGMRVSVASLTVVAPTAGNISEPNATATSRGDFFGVVTGVPRPFRESGIQDPDPAPAGSIPPIPRWDTNPETIGADSNGQTGTVAIDVGTGAVVTGLIGPLDYGFRRYTILPDVGAMIGVVGGPTATSVTAPTPSEFTAASFNMQRFFDTANDPAIGEPVLTVGAFDNRLNKASIAIRNHLQMPDIIGVAEVENLTTLQSVAARISTDAIANMQPDPLYQAYLVEGNDVGGIDVGFLVKTAIVTGATPRVNVTSVTQFGAATTITNPDMSTDLLNDRPPLVLVAVVNHPNGASFPVTVIANHLRSLNGVDDLAPGSNGWPTGGDRVRAKRLQQAEFLANLIQTRQTTDPTENIVVLGDFNAFDVNDGYGDSMGVIGGTPVPDNETAVTGDGIDLVNPDLSNLLSSLPAPERYSYAFDGQAQSLDHILINGALTSSTLARREEHARVNADFPETARNNAADGIRLSDHDPIVSYYQVAAFATAGVSITKVESADPVTAGTNLSWTITVTNAGPDPADTVSVDDTLPAGMTFVSLTAPGGWSCTTPAVGAGGTISCSIASLAVSSAVFTLTAAVDPSVVTGTVISNTATVSSTTADATPADNTATEMTTVAASADLSITKTDGVTTASPGGSVTYTITASNAGPSNASGATVADTFPASLTATWTCVGAGGGTCTAAGAGNINDTVNLPVGGSVTYTVNATISAAAVGTLSNTATVAAPAGVTDPVPGNDSATDVDTLVPEADVSISKTLTTAGPYSQGQTISYSLSVSNAGPATATNVQVTDTPTNLTIVTVTSASCAALPCTIPSLASGANEVITVTATIDAVGAFDNSATVAATETDPIAGNNTDNTGNGGTAGAVAGAPFPANAALGPATLDDYESCDVTVQPAATLLLPYFEVDPSGLGENTLVTVTNVSDTSIVAHVTVWTNWSFPVLDFNLFLTGYDVVSLSLRDLLVSGNIPNTQRGTASPLGVRSRIGASTRIEAPYTTALLAATCANPQGGNGAVPGFLLSQIQSGLTGGPYSAGGVACGQVGDVSDNMIGYITFDTSAVCSQSLPTDAPYFATEIRWENQLIGDYIRLNDAAGVAGGNPLVHIKALPGGDSTPVTTLEWTFYNRYQGGVGVADRRQPLPALFAGRYIEAGTAFDTDFVVWREGVTDEVDTVDCNGALALNASFPYVEVVRFDERENPTTRIGGCQVSPCPPNIGLSETQLINVNNTSFIPSDPSADTGGWVYFNLTIPELDPLGWGRPSQNWVQVRMTGASLYGVDFDASYLGNGCQYHVGLTLPDGGTGSSSSGEKIGPKYERGTLTGWIGN